MPCALPDVTLFILDFSLMLPPDIAFAIMLRFLRHAVCAIFWLSRFDFFCLLPPC